MVLYCSLFKSSHSLDELVSWYNLVLLFCVGHQCVYRSEARALERDCAFICFRHLVNIAFNRFNMSSNPSNNSNNSVPLPPGFTMGQIQQMMMAAMQSVVQQSMYISRQTLSAFEGFKFYTF
jgi:hypothetical protein